MIIINMNRTYEHSFRFDQKDAVEENEEEKGLNDSTPRKYSSEQLDKFERMDTWKVEQEWKGEMYNTDVEVMKFSQFMNDSISKGNELRRKKLVSMTTSKKVLIHEQHLVWSESFSMMSEDSSSDISSSRSSSVSSSSHIQVITPSKDDPNINNLTNDDEEEEEESEKYQNEVDQFSEAILQQHDLLHPISTFSLPPPPSSRFLAMKGVVRFAEMDERLEGPSFPFPQDMINLSWSNCTMAITNDFYLHIFTDDMVYFQLFNLWIFSYDFYKFDRCPFHGMVNLPTSPLTSIKYPSTIVKTIQSYFKFQQSLLFVVIILFLV